MLYSAMFAPVPPKPRPMRESHYLDSAEMLQYMRSAGCTLAEAANRCGITTQQAVNRLRLLELDEGLRAFLRQEAMPENTALLLLRLPDVVSRRRVAIRIARERLCVRDAALLVEAAKRQKPPKEAVHQQHVIKVFRDVRPFRNAIRDIAGQMNDAGVRATFTERRSGGMQEFTVAYPARRRRVERFHAK